MDPAEGDSGSARTTFVACPPRSAEARAGREADDFRYGNLAMALLVVTAIVLVVLPDFITYLNVKHQPIVPPGEPTISTDLAIAQLASLGGSAVLLGLSILVALMRGHPNRDITGVLVVLLAVNMPYLLSPEIPPPADIPKIALANVFVLALWNIGAPISGLKWSPITVAVIGVYSLIGGVVLPDYMMYNAVSEKAIVAGWELAGPFGHANVLGMYCALAFALVPILTQLRWRLIVAVILFATMVAAASRTALIAAALVVVWWLICVLRSMISIRLAGTVLVSISATATFVIPFVKWDPDAFTDRAHVWSESIAVWQQSPVVGKGVYWFLNEAQQQGNIAKWAFVGTGHNMVIDTLVRSGLVGLAVLVPLLLAAVLATRTLRVTGQQIAGFGFLMAFFTAATTEAVWALGPNLQLFPISGLVFVVLILNRQDDQTAGGPR
jgi:O-antigen ligase